MINHNRDLMKMKIKIKNRSYRHDINRHGHKYSRYKKVLSVMMLLSIKQDLSNI